MCVCVYVCVWHMTWADVNHRARASASDAHMCSGVVAQMWMATHSHPWVHPSISSRRPQGMV